MSAFDFSQSTIFVLPPTLTYTGSKESLIFTFKNKYGLFKDISSFKVIWTLSEIGRADYTILTKIGKVVDGHKAIIYLNSDDTKHLVGTKYLQQIMLTDGEDDIVCGQGIIRFNKNNNNNISMM